MRHSVHVLVRVASVSGDDLPIHPRHWAHAERWFFGGVQERILGETHATTAATDFFAVLLVVTKKLVHETRSADLTLDYTAILVVKIRPRQIKVTLSCHGPEKKKKKKDDGLLLCCSSNAPTGQLCRRIITETS